MKHVKEWHRDNLFCMQADPECLWIHVTNILTWRRRYRLAEAREIGSVGSRNRWIFRSLGIRISPRCSRGACRFLRLGTWNGCSLPCFIRRWCPRAARDEADTRVESIVLCSSAWEVDGLRDGYDRRFLDRTAPSCCLKEKRCTKNDAWDGMAGKARKRRRLEEEMPENNVTAG